jgi:hypothetical protein
MVKNLGYASQCLALYCIHPGTLTTTFFSVNEEFVVSYSKSWDMIDKFMYYATLDLSQILFYFFPLVQRSITMCNAPILPRTNFTVVKIAKCDNILLLVYVATKIIPSALRVGKFDCPHFTYFHNRRRHEILLHVYAMKINSLSMSL